MPTQTQNKEEIERRKKVMEILKKLENATVQLIENREKDVPYVYASPNKTLIIAVENKCYACVTRVRSYFVKAEDTTLTVTCHTVTSTDAHSLNKARVHPSFGDELVFTCNENTEATIPLSLIKDEAIEDLVARYIINCVAP